MFEEVFVFSRLEMTSESETNALPPPSTAYVLNVHPSQCGRKMDSHRHALLAEAARHRETALMLERVRSKMGAR